MECLSAHVLRVDRVTRFPVAIPRDTDHVTVGKRRQREYRRQRRPCPLDADSIREFNRLAMCRRRLNGRENVLLTFDQKVENVIQEISIELRALQAHYDDKFMRHLAQIVRNGLGDRAGTCIDPKTQIVQIKTVCVVSCQRCPEPVFLKWKGLEATAEGDFL